MWHYPSPWMLVVVAVDCKVSLLGITGQASHLGSFTFPPGQDIGKLNWKYPRLLCWPGFSGSFHVEWEPQSKVDDFRIHSKLNIVQFCHSLAINLPACMHCVQFHRHLTTSPSDSVCCCSRYRCVCRSPSETTIISVSVLRSDDWGSPGNLARALKSKH